MPSASPRPRPSRRRLSWFGIAAILVGVATASCQLVILRAAPGDQVATAVDDITQLVAALLGAAGCWAAARRARGRPRWGWLLIGLSAASWGAGQAVWTWLEVIKGQLNPFPSPADAGFLVAVPMAAAGVLLLQARSSSTRTRLGIIVDGVIIATGLLAVSWVTVMGPVYTAGGTSLVAQALSLGYPAGDIVIGAMLVTLATRLPRGGRLPVLLLIAGLGANCLADSGFAYLGAMGEYGPVNLVDTGWVAGYLLIGLAGLRAAARPSIAIERDKPRQGFGLLLPYLPAAAGLSLALRAELNHSLDGFLLLAVTLLVCAVLLRQFLALSDNIILVRRLASREQELQHQAHHDALTGLANRALMLRTLEDCLAGPLRHRTAILYVDLDDFKRVNDAGGHSAGDAVLRAVAGALVDSVRGGDVAARLGGDEFGVVLTELSHPAQATEVAERIIAALNNADLIVDDGAAGISASIGIAIVADDEAVTSEKLVHRADEAMYVAKTAGKGVAVQWNSAFSRAAGGGHGWLSQLERAFDKREFTLQYEPILDWRAKRIVAVEALLSWQHPDVGLLPEDRFRTALETTGLIVPAGEWALRTACAQVMEWSTTTTHDVDVHVKVDRRQFGRSDLVDVVRGALASSGLAAHRLVLEVSESTLSDFRKVSQACIGALHGLGVRFSVHDVRSGAASQAELHTLPVDMLTIHASHLDDHSPEEPGVSVAAVLLGIGASTDRPVVTAGVETLAQLHALSALRCPLMKGSYFSEPLDAQAMGEILSVGVGMSRLRVAG